MKEGIHPQVYEAKVVCTSCGSEFTTHSTLKEIRSGHIVLIAIRSIPVDRDSLQQQVELRNSIRSMVLTINRGLFLYFLGIILVL